MRVFSGIQPSGVIHIGNYLGAIRNWLELQKTHQCIFCIVDLHAITVYQPPKELKENILNLAAIYLALGLDPQKSLIFVQSHIPAHAELCWILNTITKIPEAERMTQFKEKTKEHKSRANLGLFDYPILMAADILLYQSELVPVGQDQIQHIELTRTLARRFNQLFGKTFTIPKALTKKEGARIMGLDNPRKKMAKSASSYYNYIGLSDAPALIIEKIKKAVTDSGKEIVASPKKPALTNLLNIYAGFSNQGIKEIEKKYRGKGYAEFKEDLAEVIIKSLAPLQKKFQQLRQNETILRQILKEGAESANRLAQETLTKVKQKMGLMV